MSKSSSQGRFYLLESGPVASPGHCAICGFSGSERRYLDPRLDFEFFGSVIFCEICVVSMAQMFGLLTAEHVAEVEAERDNALTELIKLNAVAAAMEDLNVAVGAYRGEINSSDGGNPLVGDAGSDIPESDERPPNFSDGPESGESSFDVTSLGQGPDDLSSAASNKPRGLLDL